MKRGPMLNCPFPALTLLLTLGLGPWTNLAQAQTKAKAKSAPAQQTVPLGPGDLLVSPNRVVFDARHRTMALNLSNIGTAEAVYRIALVRMEMDEEGGMAEKALDTSPGAVNLPGLIRFSPREVVLAPGEAQTLRLQVRKPADLAAGEYRIHMLFRAVPPAPEVPKDTGAPPPKGISVKLIPLYGLAIPLIVRQGETSAKAALSGLTLDPATHTLHFHLDRTGNQSVYGDFKARWAPATGAATTVGEMTGVAAYVPNATRKIAMVLVPPKGGGIWKGGRMKVTFSAPPLEGGALLAEASLDLP